MSLSQQTANRSGPERTARRRTVADVMTTGVVSAHLDAPVKEIAAAMARNRISAVPVLESRRTVVGVVTATDLLRHFGGEQHGAPPDAQLATAHSVMSRDPVTVRPETTILAAARLAAERHLHFLPVVADGVLAGCVTAADLAKVYVRPDADICAEIELMLRDEPVQPGALHVTVAEGVVTIAGGVASRARAAHLVEQVATVPGVIDVRGRFSYRDDPGDG